MKNENAKKDKQKAKHFLNLAGEYGVCAELFKRGVHAYITHGNQKAVDLFITGAKKTFLLEVKTTNKKKFVTKFFQKYTSPETRPCPDFWVMACIDPVTLVTEFYVLTHKETAQEQMTVNRQTVWEEVKGGMDNIPVNQLQQYLGKWETIINAIEQ